MSAPRSVTPIPRLAPLALVATLITPAIAAAEVTFDGNVSSIATSNVFLDRAEEEDLVLRPSAQLDAGFADFWSVGYSGQLNAYLRHEDLLSHRHEVFLFANPAWGEDSQNELVLQAAVETLRNQPAYSDLDLTSPSVVGKLAIEPASWLRWQLSADVGFRFFENDRPSSSLDAHFEGRLTFMLPSRTTVVPSAAYGVRSFMAEGRRGAASGTATDDLDQQVDAGVRIGQGLWTDAGLQLEYGYRLALDDSGLLERKTTDAQFQYIGEDFLFSGHRGHLALKQLVGESWTLGATAAGEERDYAGWPAIDAAGVPTGEDRRDVRLTGRASVGYRKERVGVTLDGSYTHQSSNSYLYDTAIAATTLDIWLTW